MEELIGNTNSELLHLYVDGELNPSMEPQLFDELAVNEDLRSEMRDLLAIRSSIQNDAESFAVPISSQGAIFNRVGLIPPIIMPPPAALQPVAAGGAAWLTLFRNAWAPALVAIVSIIGTSLILTNHYNDKIDGIQSENSIAQKSLNDKLTAKNLNDSKNNLNNQNIIPSEKVRIVYRYSNRPTGLVLAENDQKNEQIANSNEQSKPADFSHVEKAQMFSLSPNIRIDNKNDFINNNSIGTQFDIGSLANLLKSIESKYSLYVRGMSAKSFPATDMPTTSDPLFTNMSIGTYIHNNKNVQFGIELGQESYTQVFENIEDGVKYQYMKTPVVFWGALGAILISDKVDFLAGTQPYAQFIIGGSTQGLIGKTIAGIQMNSTDMGIGILLGVEGSVLLYQNQKIWYSTRKLGFTFGTSIHF